MLPGARIICLSPIPWSGLWTSRHEMATELARRGADVVFVDPPVNAVRRPVAARRDRPRVRQPRPGIRVVTPPPYLPYGVLRSRPSWQRRWYCPGNGVGE